MESNCTFTFTKKEYEKAYSNLYWDNGCDSSKKEYGELLFEANIEDVSIIKSGRRYVFVIEDEPIKNEILRMRGK